MTEQEQKAFEQMREALKLAMDNLRPHGDNCFLHDVGEYNSCFCGKDSLVDHLHSVVESAALTAANAVSHPKTETAPVTEGGAITSESTLALLVKEMRYIATITNGQAHRIAMMTLEKVAAANAVNAFGTLINEGTIASVQPQAQGESYSERWYGSGEDRGWWIVRGGLVKREHVAFLGEFVSPEEVSKVVAELNAAHPQATEPAPQEWISVDDQMPPPMERVLAIEPRHRTVKVDMWFGPDFQWSYTHWMPLPAAPEAKQ